MTSEELNELLKGQQPEPTDEKISTTDSTITKLTELKNSIKFGPEPQSSRFPLGYVGLLPEENQPKANEHLNSSIQRLIDLLEKNPTPTKDEVLNEFKIGLNPMKDIAIDTEDRERVCEYYSDIRVIIGFETTNGVLNDWMYGLN